MRARDKLFSYSSESDLWCFFICFSFLFYFLLHCFVIWIILQGRVLISFFCDRNPPGPWFNTKMLFYQYRKSHCGDKRVVRSSYIHNGISYTGKMSSLYWIRAQGSMDSPYKEPIKWKAFPCHDMFCSNTNTLSMTSMMCAIHSPYGQLW